MSEKRIPGAYIQSGYTIEEAIRSVGPGWASLVRSGLEFIEARGGKVTQVQRKLRHLRIYWNGARESWGEIYDEMLRIERLSGSICEACGIQGVDVTRGKGIIETLKTLCDSCDALWEAGERDVYQIAKGSNKGDL